MKKILCSLLTSALIFSIAVNYPAVAKQTKINAFVDYLKKNGINVTSKESKSYQMVGAIDGTGLNVGDGQFEVYEYDTKNLKGNGKKYYNQAKNGSLEIMQGVKSNAIINKSLMMIAYNDDDDEAYSAKLVKLFKKYKAK